MKKLLSLVLTFLMFFAFVPFSVIADETVPLVGDINGNGIIDMTDYILLKRAYFGTYTFTDAQNKAGDINGNGKIDMTDYILLKRIYFGTYKIGDEIPDVNTDYIQNPTQEDFDVFYRMAPYYYDWTYDETQYEYNEINSFYSALGFYSYFGYKIDLIECQEEYVGDQWEDIWDAEYYNVYDWDDPLDKFHFNDGDGGFWYGDVIVYDAEAIIWIGENVFGSTPEFVETDYAYYHDGKYYEVQWGENIGHPGIFTDVTEKNYEYLGDGEYLFHIKYSIDDSAYYEVDTFDLDIIAKPKYNETHGTYWQFISIYTKRTGNYTYTEYYGEDYWY